MARKILFPVLMGLAGCGVLIWLGLWQVDRLGWKQQILANIDARLAAAPAPLRLDATEAQDEYSRVTLSGVPDGNELHVLVSGTSAGTGYRVIVPLTLDDGARILVDLGLLPLEAKNAAPLIAPMQISGTLLWPDDRNDSTPDPDFSRNIWFARDVAIMSDALDTLPLMVVVSQASPADPRLTALPVTTADIKNDHLEYAITWFLLALVWAIMSMVLILRTLRQKDI